MKHFLEYMYHILLKISSPLFDPQVLAHMYVYLDYKPPSHQVDCTHTRAHKRVRTYVTLPFK